MNNEAPNATGSREGPNDKNFTKGKIASRIAHLEADIERYITEMVRIDRQEDGEAKAGKVEHLSRRHGRIR